MTVGMKIRKMITILELYHHIETLHISFFRPSTSISIPKVDNEPQFIHIKQPFADVTEDIKAMIPRHLRKPWKLLHKANYGSREEHLNAVRELSNVTHNLRYCLSSLKTG